MDRSEMVISFEDVLSGYKSVAAEYARLNSITVLHLSIHSIVRREHSSVQDIRHQFK